MKKIRSEIKYQQIATFCLVIAGILFAGSALAGSICGTYHQNIGLKRPIRAGGYL